MRLIKFLTVMSFVIPGIAACNSMPEGDHAGMKGSYEENLSQAKSALQKAEEVGNAWVNTGTMIAEAEELAKAGDQAKAMKLLEEATFQSEMAVKQFESQKNAGPTLF